MALLSSTPATWARVSSACGALGRDVSPSVLPHLPLPCLPQPGFWPGPLLDRPGVIRLARCNAHVFTGIRVLYLRDTGLCLLTCASGALNKPG